MLSPYRLAATKHPYHLIPLFLGFLWCCAASYFGDGATDWTILLAAESIYQIFAPDFAFFKNATDLELNRLRSEAASQAKYEAGDAIEDYQVRERYRGLVGLELRIREHLAKQPPELAALTDIGPLASNLLRNFLRLAKAYSGIRTFLHGADPKSIESVLDQLRKRQLPNEDGTYDLAAGLRQAEANRIAVLEARFRKIEEVRDREPEISTQLASLEDSLQLMHDQLLAPSEESRIRIDVQNVLKSIRENGSTEVASALLDAEDADAEMEALRAEIEESRKGR